MMYKYYLSLPLAIGITLLSATSGLTEVVVSRNYKQIALDSDSSVATQATIEDTSSTVQAKTSNYLGLMNAGYAASQKQDYLTAINYFRQALTLQPKDSQAEKAIKNISSYGFDLYMRSGYTADRVRNYTTALQSFQKALQIRPDSLHAKQAVNNITYYLAQQPVDSDSANENGRDGGFNLWFLLIAIGVASGLSAVLLFYLFKKTNSSPQEESQSENSESLAEMTAESKLEEFPSAILDDDVDIVEESPEPEKTHFESSFKSQSTNSSAGDIQPPQTTFVNESSNNTSIVASSNSLVKLDIVPELIRDLSTSDRTLRRKAVWELAQRGDSRAMKPLVELMVEVDSQERGLILEAMTQIAGRTLKPMNKAIMMSLEDDNSQVKQNAIRDLTRVYELMSQITKRLSEAVEDSDAQVQETAKWALRKLNQMPTNSNADAARQTDNLTNEINNLNNSNGTNGTGKNKEKNYPLS